MYTNSCITMFQEEMKSNTHLYPLLQMVQTQNHSKLWLKKEKKQKILVLEKSTEMFTNSFTIMSQEEMSLNIQLSPQLQMVQIQNHSKLWLKNLKKQKILVLEKSTEMFTNSFTIMSQEEMSLNIQLYHQLQMDLIQNLLRL